MATLIRLKRKKSSGNTGIVLAAGEAYYNTADKRLYIGNTDGEDASSASKKHIAQITPIDAGETTVKFQLGEDENNVYEKTIRADAIEGTISSAKDAVNVSSTIAGTAIGSLFTMSSNKPQKAKKAAEADSATKATYASDDPDNSIGTRFSNLTTDLESVTEELTAAKTTLQGNIDTLSSTVASNKTTTDASITMIVNGATPVAKATSATTATTANDVSNLSLESSSEATIKLTWGPKSEHSTSFTVSGESIGGTVTSAENVTKSINGNAITDIFSGTVAKKAQQLNTARSLTTKLDSTSAGSFDGTANVNIGVSGTLPLANGGTGATTAAQALKNLGVNATAAELNLLEDATSNIQGQLDGKQAKITGGATSIASSNLTVSRALVSDGNGKVAVSDVTSTELKYLDGVTSNVQTQLNGKAATSHGNHVPTVETANSARFLRNDNSWQTVTPAAIGAAPETHGTHVSYGTSAPVKDGTASAGSASTVSRSDHVHPTDDTRAPKSHASSATTYGAATTSNYGHVKISNGDCNSVASVNGLAAGMDHTHSNYASSSHTHSELEWKSF